MIDDELAGHRAKAKSMSFVRVQVRVYRTGFFSCADAWVRAFIRSHRSTYSGFRSPQPFRGCPAAFRSLRWQPPSSRAKVGKVASSRRSGSATSTRGKKCSVRPRASGATGPPRRASRRPETVSRRRPRPPLLSLGYGGAPSPRSATSSDCPGGYPSAPPPPHPSSLVPPPRASVLYP